MLVPARIVVAERAQVMHALLAHIAARHRRARRLLGVHRTNRSRFSGRVAVREGTVLRSGADKR